MSGVLVGLCWDHCCLTCSSMTQTLMNVGSRAPSTTLQTLSWEAWLTCLRDAMPSKGTWARPRVGMCVPEVQQGQVQGPEQGSSNLQNEYRLWDKVIESSPVRRTCGDLWMKNWTWAGNVHLHLRKPTVSWMHQKKYGHAGWGSWWSLPPSLCLVPGVLHPALESSVQERLSPVGAGLVGDHEWEHFSYKERLRDLGMSSLKKSGFWGDLITASQYLKGIYKKWGQTHLVQPLVIGQVVMVHK